MWVAFPGHPCCAGAGSNQPESKRASLGKLSCNPKSIIMMKPRSLVPTQRCSNHLNRGSQRPSCRAGLQKASPRGIADAGESTGQQAFNFVSCTGHEQNRMVPKSQGAPPPALLPPIPAARTGHRRSLPWAPRSAAPVCALSGSHGTCRGCSRSSTNRSHQEQLGHPG